VERRALLLQTLEQRPRVKEVVARHIATLSDADVERVLKQLESLGLLSDDASDTKP